MQNAPSSIARVATRRQFLRAAGLAPVALQGVPAWAQAFPSRPVRLIVPFPPGGPTDLVARPLAHALSGALGQQVVVDNRGGAGGSLGADAVAKAQPDGYTLLMGTVGTQAINQSLYKKLSYDAARDFTPIGIVASSSLAAVVHPDAPFKTVAALIEAARRAPGQISYGSAGNGTPGHLTGHMFSAAAEIQLSHIPYRGSAPAISDLLAGQIRLMFDPVQSVLEHLKAGKLQALAVSGGSRLSVLPQVPTFAEAGLKGFETAAWWGVFAPAATPAPVAQALAAAVRSVAGSDDFRRRMESLGVQIPQLTDAAMARFQRAEMEKWGKAVRESGVSVD
jgi:tripartite-type tricarboxylate transporter receptor subunit TctC